MVTVEGTVASVVSLLPSETTTDPAVLPDRVTVPCTLRTLLGNAGGCEGDRERVARSHQRLAGQHPDLLSSRRTIAGLYRVDYGWPDDGLRRSEIVTVLNSLSPSAS